MKIRYIKIIVAVLTSLCIFSCRGKAGIKEDSNGGAELIPYLKANGKYVYVERKTMKITLSKEYDEAHLFYDGLACVKRNNLYGFINQQGKEVIPVRFELARDFSCGRAWVIPGGFFSGRFRIIDRNGRYVSKMSYQEASDFKDGLAIVARKTLSDDQNVYGVIDVSGKEILPLNYAAVTLAEHGLIKVNVARKYSGGFYFVRKAYSAKTGKEILLPDDPMLKGEDFLFDNSDSTQTAFTVNENYTIGNFNEYGLAPVRLGMDRPNSDISLYANGYIDTNLRLVIPPVYSALDNVFMNGVSAAEKNGKWGLINTRNELIIPLLYDYLKVGDGLVIAKQSNKESILDLNGRKLFDAGYDELRLFSCGHAAVRKGDKWGFIDKKDSVVIPFQYDEVNAFHEGFAAVSLNGKWGFIDQVGKIITPLVYDEAKDFYKGVASVRMIKTSDEDKQACDREEWGAVDITGKEIIPPVYNYFSFYDDLFAVLSKGNKKGLVRNDGKIIAPPIYNNIWSPQDGYASFSTGKFAGIINENGVEVMPANKYTYCYNLYDRLFAENLALCEYRGTDGKGSNCWGLFDLKAGKELLPPVFYDLKPVMIESFELWIANIVSNQDSARIIRSVYVDRKGAIYAEYPERLIHNKNR